MKMVWYPTQGSVLKFSTNFPSLLPCHKFHRFTQSFDVYSLHFYAKIVPELIKCTKLTYINLRVTSTSQDLTILGANLYFSGFVNFRNVPVKARSQPSL